MAVENLTKANPDGTNFGQSTTDKIGFYGLATPIVQPADTSQSAVSTAAITTVVATVVTSTVWATAINDLISRQAAIITLLNRARTDLVALNLIKGSI